MDKITSSRRSWDEIEPPGVRRWERVGTGQGEGLVRHLKAQAISLGAAAPKRGFASPLYTWRQCGAQYRPHRAAKARRYAHPRGFCQGFRRQSGREFDYELPPPKARRFHQMPVKPLYSNSRAITPC